MDLDLISNTVLFRGCPKEDIEAMARHLNFRTNQYKKGNVVFHSGEIITDAGLVLPSLTVYKTEKRCIALIL